jgi:hypothetical protein
MAMAKRRQIAITVVRHDNGKLGEDVVHPDEVAETYGLDDELAETFPASDPLSHWSGP